MAVIFSLSFLVTEANDLPVPADTNPITFSIWAADNVVYGPVELPALIAWVKDQRVLADTWIFDGGNDRWRKASTLPELQICFSASEAPARRALDTAKGISSTNPTSHPTCCDG